MKQKNIIIIAVVVLLILIIAGLAYASLTGVLKIGNTEFSEKYYEYQEKENQFVEKEGTKVELKSKVCDDGFIVLQFDVTLSDALSQEAAEKSGLQYLSFNDEIIEENGVKTTRLSGANYNLILDGKLEWLRGATSSDILENIANKNYTVYQLWFLSENELEGKNDFTITLDDIAIMTSEKLTTFDGKFDINLSKNKVLENEKVFDNTQNEVVKYKRLTNKIEKVVQTPLQNLIKVSETITDVTRANYNHLDNEDCIATLEYVVYDQNNNKLNTQTIETKNEYIYSNGQVKQSEVGEIFTYNGFTDTRSESYIAFANNGNITGLTVEVHEKNEYLGTTRLIGEMKISLQEQTISATNKDEVIDTNTDAPVTWNVDTIKTNEIKEFSIDLDEKYTITKDEEDDVVTYNISLDDRWLDFSLVLFDDTNVYETYDSYIKGDLEPKLIDENDKYKLVLVAMSQMDYNEIQNIVETIKLK